VLIIGTALLWSSSIQAAVPASWKETGFSINANGMTLREVINEFGDVYGVRVSFGLRNGKPLRGRLKADTGNDFLDRLTHSHKFRWFVYNGTLYIVPSKDNVSVRLEVGEDVVQDAKAALVGLGLFDRRFGWGELPDEGVVMVSGPREYVNLAREILMPNTKSGAVKGKQIMVFRLKYASATDRVIQTRGQQETIRGIKSILTDLLNPASSSGSSSHGDEFDAASEKRSREGKNGRGSAYEAGAGSRTSGTLRDDAENDRTGRASKSKDAQHEGAPRIDADASLNAIMIYDDAKKRDMYQALIAELDVEPRQIEIEALIVDIDRSKLSEMGVEWGVRSGNGITRVNSTTGDSQGVDLPLPGATLLISNAARFYTRLKALEGSGEAHVLAKPTVLTLENVAAVLDLSQTAYVPLVGERVADLAHVTAGTMLRVVPRVVQEGATTRVRLEVDIEDGSLGNPNDPNTIATRSTISTQAIVDLQQTLMIGGYHAESRSTNQQKVPVLGDVPLFGGLFRSNTESHNGRERLFLITPRLLGSAGVEAAGRSKANGLAERVAAADQLAAVQAQAQEMAAQVTDGEAELSAGDTDEPAQSTPQRRTKAKCGRPKVGFRSTLR
jgi:type III secretion protein C